MIDGLKGGESAAASLIWERFFERLVSVARQRLGNTPRRAADEEDIAISVFDSLCRGAARGNFSQLASREDLWKLLLAITHQKVVDQKRRQGRKKRGGGAVRGESVFAAKKNDDANAGIDQFAVDTPTPELLVEMEEQYQQLLDSLRDDSLRQIAIWRMEGHTNDEIAKKVGVTTRSVERKLKLIREKWTKLLQP